jgi:hypothetical protein
MMTLPIIGLLFVLAGALAFVLRKPKRDDSHAKHLAAHRAVIATMPPQVKRKPAKAAPTKKVQRAHWKKGRTITDRAFDVFAANPQKEFHAKEISSLIGVRLDTCFAALSKLFVGGFLLRTGPGVYKYAGKAGE